MLGDAQADGSRTREVATGLSNNDLTDGWHDRARAHFCGPWI